MRRGAGRRTTRVPVRNLMSVNGKFKHIQREDLLVLAGRFQIGPASRLLAEVRNAVAAR